MNAIQRIELSLQGIEQLQREALEEGYLFVERLCAEWRNGTNRFRAPGERLYGCLDQSSLIAIGGLNQDPFADRPDIGRIRRVYVRPAWRNRGIGNALIRTLVEDASANFTALRLRTDNPSAGRLYERIGFSRISTSEATHILVLNRAERSD